MRGMLNRIHRPVHWILEPAKVFGRSRGGEMATAAGAPLLGQLPIDPALAKLCDEGNIERYDAGVVGSLGEALARSVPVEKGKKAG